ncbi:zinc finger, CCHC-type containing protein [Tanacetum coccineum]
MGDENPIRTLGDYSKPSHKGYRNNIKLPAGNDMVPLRSDTFRLVQNGCSFHGLWSEDPNQNLKDFLKLVDSLKLDGENRERTRLCLFQFSLRDQASNWLERLPAGSISTWEDLTTRFLAQFFPPGRTAKLCNDILMFQKHHEESLSEAWTYFKDLLQKVPHHGIDRPIPQPQALDTTFEDRVRDYMAAHTERMEIFENTIFKQREEINGRMTNMFGLLKELTTSRTPEKVLIREEAKFPVLPSYQIKLEKALLDFDSNQEKTLSHLRTQLEQQHDDMIGKINLLWKTVSEKLNDASPPKNAGNSMAPKSITAISHDKKEELRKKGIKSPSILLSLKYLSPASIKELNKNPLSLKRVHFINSIVILSTDNDKEEDEMETDMEVEEVIEEEDSEFKTNDEVKEIFEEDEDDENFNSFPTIKELSHHEWLLKNPQPS